MKVNWQKNIRFLVLGVKTYQEDRKKMGEAGDGQPRTASYQGLGSTEHFYLTEMFEENKTKNPPHLVCKILMNICNTLLVGK